MAAECYWCRKGNPTIKNPLGGLDKPIGCCSKCQSLVCGHHGQRDAILRSFMCFDCDITILVNSAINLSGQNLSGSDWDEDLVFVVFNGGPFYLFKSFDDFKKHRPGYEGWFREMLDNQMKLPDFDMNTANGKLFGNLTGEARKLLAAASFIISHLYEDMDVSNVPAYYSVLRNDTQFGI